MGSDNSGKRAKASKFLIPAVASVILVFGCIIFFVAENPNQVSQDRGHFVVRSFATIENALGQPNVFRRASQAAKAAISRSTSMMDSQALEDRRPIASVDHILDVFKNYLWHMHIEFDKIHIGDTPEIAAEEVWEKYVEVTNEYIMPLELDYRLPSLDPSGDTIFVSVGSYRDENCPNTLTEIFKHADEPEGISIGLVEQNCYANCMTGVLKDLSVRDAPPDVDCVKDFCDGEMGKYCDHLRVVRVNESESLGPAMSRYFGSKLWNGESFYMQIDSHMFFADHWDTDLKQMMADAERSKPIITTYPPPEDWSWQGTVGNRICDGYFTDPGGEEQIVRLEGSMQLEQERPARPKFAPYIAAGFAFSSGSFIRDVPFDPFSPWVFMGEEIILSSRAFTNGYHIFSPTINVLAHMYVRRNKPKFWETVGRTFKRPGFHNQLNRVVIRRLKHILGYPENDADLLWPPSLGVYEEKYGMGKLRTLGQYLDMVGLDTVAKTNRRLDWCHKGQIPPELLRLEKEEAAKAKAEERRRS